MKAQDFKSITPPWIDIERWKQWVLSKNVLIIEGSDHNKTDGEIHYFLRSGNKEYNMRANYWNWEVGWQDAIDWIDSLKAT